MFKELAIVGATASGKSKLAIKLAQQSDAMIFSIDSLSVYKEMDIVSAKPTTQERQGIPHFGIDVLKVPQPFNAAQVITLYQEAKEAAQKAHRPLIIVGGSSFYLKTLIEGLSPLPTFSPQTRLETERYLQDLPSAYAYLQSIDPQATQNIDANDRYRMEKLLLVALQTQDAPTRYFQAHPPQSQLKNCPLFNIKIDREKLYQRIALRTEIMLEQGLIDEVAYLERKYSRAPQAMKAIGVIETLAYLDGIYTKKGLLEAIAQNTRRLAKRQSTFNKTQFKEIKSLSAEALFEAASTLLSNP